jgi:hypothetical protein
MTSLHFFPPAQSKFAPTVLPFSLLRIFDIVALLTAVTSFGLGFYLGTRSVDLQESSDLPAKDALRDDDSEEEKDEMCDGDLSAVKAGYMEPCKLVCSLILRWITNNQLNMTEGPNRPDRFEDDSRKDICTVSVALQNVASMEFTWSFRCG